MVILQQSDRQVTARQLINLKGKPYYTGNQCRITLAVQGWKSNPGGDIVPIINSSIAGPALLNEIYWRVYYPIA